LIPVVQQAFDTEPVEDGSILGEVAALKIIHQTDGRKHQRIAGEMTDVRMVHEAGDDPRAVRLPFTPRFRLGLVAGQSHSRTPVTRVLPDLGLAEVKHVAFNESERAESPGRVADGAGRNEIAAIRIVSAEFGQPGDDATIAQVRVDFIVGPKPQSRS